MAYIFRPKTYSSVRNKDFCKGNSDLDGAVSIVALSDIHQTGQTVDGAKVKVVEAVFAAGKGQHYGIGRRLLYKLCVVVAAGACAVAAGN